LIIRSQTKVPAEVVKAGKNLKLIGRADAGVDNIDVDEATRQGILVVNAPTSNTVAVAEHAFGLMLALARHIPQASDKFKSGV
jgi:D-3-phosphoglycerate dehydrogenase